MKSPITILCSCGTKVPLEINGSKLPRSVQCPACPANIVLVPRLGNTVTDLIINRAGVELENGDITLAILLSAMAVEGEMSWLFFHWKKTDRTPGAPTYTSADEESWENEWAEMRAVKMRLHQLSLFLTTKDFDSFAFQNKSLFKSVKEEYDSSNTHTSPKIFFQKLLFDKRNKIVHYGNVDSRRSDGEICLSVALALLRILSAMHQERIKRMDEDHNRIP
jgi:hypothetical protein